VGVTSGATVKAVNPHRIHLPAEKKVTGAQTVRPNASDTGGQRHSSVASQVKIVHHNVRLTIEEAAAPRGGYASIKKEKG